MGCYKNHNSHGSQVLCLILPTPPHSTSPHPTSPTKTIPPQNTHTSINVQANLLQRNILSMSTTTVSVGNNLYWQHTPTDARHVSAQDPLSSTDTFKQIIRKLLPNYVTQPAQYCGKVALNVSNLRPNKCVAGADSWFGRSR